MKKLPRDWRKRILDGDLEAHELLPKPLKATRKRRLRKFKK